MSMRGCYRRTLATCAIFACACAMTGASPAHAATRAASGVARTPTRAPALVRQLVAETLQLLDADRAQAGLGPLTLDQPLMGIAMGHSRDMAARHYFDHTAPGDSSAFDRFARAGIQYDDAAENLGRAEGRPPDEEIAQINADMMAEPLDGASHHDIIVDPHLHRVGIGICIEPGDTVYLTEDFTN